MTTTSCKESDTPSTDMRSVGAAMVSLANQPMLRQNELNSPRSTEPRTNASVGTGEGRKRHHEPVESSSNPGKAGQLSYEKSDNGRDMADDSSDDSDDNSSDEAADVPSWKTSDHRAFIEAVFHVGIRQASPSVILELMQNEDNQPLTTERVKSRLQKYRNNFRRSHAEFMHEYDLWMAKAMAVGRSGCASNYAEPSAILEMMGIEKLMGGDVAAYLTYSCMAEDSKETESKGESDPLLMAQQYDQLVGSGENLDGLTPQQLWNGSQEYTKIFTGSKISLPTLTDKERASALGISLNHVISLFYSMTQHVMQKRANGESASLEKTMNQQEEEDENQEEPKKKKRKPPPQPKSPSPERPEEARPEQKCPPELPRQEQAAQALYTMADVAAGSSISHGLSNASTSTDAVPLSSAASSSVHHPLLLQRHSRSAGLDDYHFMQQQLPRAHRSEAAAMAPLMHHQLNIGNGGTHYPGGTLHLQSPASLPLASGSYSLASSLPSIGALPHAAPGQQCIVYVQVPENSRVSRQS